MSVFNFTRIIEAFQEKWKSMLCLKCFVVVAGINQKASTNIFCSEITWFILINYVMMFSLKGCLSIGRNLCSPEKGCCRVGPEKDRLFPLSYYPRVLFLRSVLNSASYPEQGIRLCCLVRWKKRRQGVGTFPREEMSRQILVQMIEYLQRRTNPSDIEIQENQPPVLIAPGIFRTIWKKSPLGLLDKARPFRGLSKRVTCLLVSRPRVPFC